MNKMNYLFDACVSHRNTQSDTYVSARIQRNLEDFFNKQEALYEEWYEHSRYSKDNDNDDYDDDYDEYHWKPKKIIPINSWDDALSLTEWDDQWEPEFNIPRRRRTYYKGYLYRKMSLTEFNRYLKGSLDVDNREWNQLNHCSHNIGYCFLGNHSLGVMNDWTKNISLDDDMFKPCSDLRHVLSHVGCGHSSYIYKDSWNMRYQEVYCKFYYEGPIWQSIAYYGEHDPYDGYYMNNYMIEYGLTDYSKLKLESVQIHVRDSRMYGMPHHGYKKVNC